MLCVRGVLELVGSMGPSRGLLAARAGAAAEAARRKYAARASRMKITVCGAAGNTGQPLSLLLKQSPLVDELALYDVFSTCGVGMELGHVDTKCGVTSYSGICMLCDSLKDARVVVIAAKSPAGDSFENNAPIVSCLAAHISDMCPTAVTVVATEPVESMTALVAEIQRARGTYDPRRLLGVTEHNHMRANLVLADFLCVTPERISVMVVAGVTPNTMVPVLSSAVYPANLSQQQMECVTAMILGCEGMESCAMRCTDGACLSGAYGIARTVVNVVKGLTGRTNVVQTGYVDTDCKYAPGCQFLANDVLLGTAGIEKTLGIPQLSPFENCLLINSVPHIRKEIAKAEWTVAAMSEDPCTYAHMYPRQCTNHPCVCSTQCCRMDLVKGKEDKEKKPCGSPCLCCGQNPCCCCANPCHICGCDPCKCAPGTCKCCGKSQCICASAAAKKCSADPAPATCRVCCQYPCVCCLNPPCTRCGRTPCVCRENACLACGQRPCACPAFNKKALLCKGCGKFPCACPRPTHARGRTHYGSMQPVCLCCGWDWSKKPDRKNYDNPKGPCRYCYPAHRWTPRASNITPVGCEEAEHQLNIMGHQCGGECKKLPASVRCDCK